MMAQRFKILTVYHTCVEQGEFADHLLVHEETTFDDVMRQEDSAGSRSVIHGIFTDLPFANDIADLLNARSLN